MTCWAHFSCFVHLLFPSPGPLPPSYLHCRSSRSLWLPAACLLPMELDGVLFPQRQVWFLSPLFPYFFIQFLIYSPLFYIWSSAAVLAAPPRFHRTTQISPPPTPPPTIGVGVGVRGLSGQAGWSGRPVTCVPDKYPFPIPLFFLYSLNSLNYMCKANTSCAVKLGYTN